MSTRVSSIPPKINIGALTGLPWLQKGYSYGFNDSGPFQIWIEEGLDADVDTNSINFSSGGWTYTVERLGGGLSRLTARAGWSGGSTYTSETANNIWELDPQETDKDILSADFPFGSFTGISKDTRAQLAKIVANENYDSLSWYGTVGGGGAVLFQGGEAASGGTPNYLFDDGTNDRNSDGSLADASNYHLPIADYVSAHSLYLLMKAGVQAFPVEASIVRHTQLLSNQYSVKAGFSNVGRIISSGSMTSIESAPSTLLFDIPASPTPAQFIETAGDLQYGWKKSRPAVSRLALYKWRVVNNYQFGLWPVKLFGSVL